MGTDRTVSQLDSGIRAPANRRGRDDQRDHDSARHGRNQERHHQEPSTEQYILPRIAVPPMIREGNVVEVRMKMQVTLYTLAGLPARLSKTVERPPKNRDTAGSLRGEQHRLRDSDPAYRTMLQSAGCRVAGS
jgi:hypothetical protein